MEYTTLLTHQTDSPWRAVVPGLPDCAAEAPTRAEILVKIQKCIAEMVSYTEVLQIEVPASPKSTNGTSTENPKPVSWQWFGTFQDDAQWKELFKDIEQQRDVQLVDG